MYFQVICRTKQASHPGLAWERLGITTSRPVMVARALVRSTTVVSVALLLGTPTGTPNAYAGQPQHGGVQRLWSQFPLGPHLRTHLGAPTSKPPPPGRSTPARSHSRPHREASSRPSESSRFPPWAWALIAVAAVLLAAAVFWLRYPPRPKAARPLDGPSDQAVDVTPAPPRQHPWTSSGEPRTLDTLPRAELFAMANALGIEHTVSMSRWDLVMALRPVDATASARASEASEHELVRYAAMYSAACHAGNPVPMEAVTAALPPTVTEPVVYSRQVISEARRRGLLASPAEGRPGGELTARAKALLPDQAGYGRTSTRR